ncbi:hypothetical protein K1Y77_17265 (plasmid) [Halomonas qaidamensis]|uniref:CARDB domain-containing protein n=1 Tax=Halomonas qaidamensis TaxID=2866211 RepID=A0ABY6JUA6_9GAMM|nr:hypothetical protein [Halomonas qaidamensis]UYV20911.1 hypothetical protein K1Y77_17265 [Halomonas qaidamensis]
MLKKEWSLILVFISKIAYGDVVVIDTHVSKDPLIFEVTIENASDTAVARGYIAAHFVTPGREVPWVSSWEQHYSVPGGVENGEAYTLELSAPPEIADIQDYEVTAEVFFFSAFSENRAPLNDDAEFVAAELERQRLESEALQADLDEMMKVGE